MCRRKRKRVAVRALEKRREGDKMVVAKRCNKVVVDKTESKDRT